MAIDPSSFYPHSVTDTCAVWNVLSSRLLYSVACDAHCHFVCTGYVVYECLLKPRKENTPEDEELKKRLRHERKRGRFQDFHLTLDDILDLTILERRQNLGKGELSSLAFARHIRQAFLTDDQKARKLATEVCDARMVQTTPHLLGWLFYIRRLLDSDLDTVVTQHQELNGPLSKYFKIIYQRALEYRARDETSNKGQTTSTM